MAWARASLLSRLHDHPRTHHTLWSARRRENTHNRHPCLGWDSNPQLPASERPKTHTLHNAATGLGYNLRYELQLNSSKTWKFTLKMEAGSSYEMSVYFNRTARRHIPEDSNIHCHHSENLKPHISLSFFEHMGPKRTYVSITHTVSRLLWFKSLILIFYTGLLSTGYRS
jgi:hypothetical protein